MKILAVDTALGACSAAILDGETTLAHRFEPMERGHAEALAPMVEAAMRDANLAFAELDRLAVTTGPGTFTGQRVGLAFMRGLRVASPPGSLPSERQPDWRPTRQVNTRRRCLSYVPTAV